MNPKKLPTINYFKIILRESLKREFRLFPDNSVSLDCVEGMYKELKNILLKDYSIKIPEIKTLKQLEDS